MDALFTILVIGLALFSIVAVMFLILREKVDHDAHQKYVRSPWTDEATEAQEQVDAQFQKRDEAAQPTVTSPYADEKTNG